MCEEVVKSLFQLLSWHSLEGLRRTMDIVSIYARTSNCGLSAYKSEVLMTQ